MYSIKYANFGLKYNEIKAILRPFTKIVKNILCLCHVFKKLKTNSI
jgi:hypothetical protein